MLAWFNSSRNNIPAASSDMVITETHGTGSSVKYPLRSGDVGSGIPDSIEASNPAARSSMNI